MIEGLHPFFDDRVADLLDFKIYLDISDDVKFAWKLQVLNGSPAHSARTSVPSTKHRSRYDVLFGIRVA